jgi:hypothetical protein
MEHFHDYGIRPRADRFIDGRLSDRSGEGSPGYIRSPRWILERREGPSSNSRQQIEILQREADQTRPLDRPLGRWRRCVSTICTLQVHGGFCALQYEFSP